MQTSEKNVTSRCPNEKHKAGRYLKTALMLLLRKFHVHEFPVSFNQVAFALENFRDP